jgi:hypothetical protein
MLTASTADFLAHVSTTSRRSILLSVIPGAESSAQHHSAVTSIALAPVIEVDQQPAREQLVAVGAAGRALQGAAEGVGAASQQHGLDGLQFYALPALDHSTGVSATESQSATPLGGRRSLLCFSCPVCISGSYAVAIDIDTFKCYKAPFGWFADQAAGGILTRCPAGMTRLPGSLSYQACSTGNRGRRLVEGNASLAAGAWEDGNAEDSKVLPGIHVIQS